MQEPTRPPAPRQDDKAGVLVGAVIVAIGAWLFLRPFLVESPLWQIASRFRHAGWPLVLILAGVALIVFASRPDRPHMPPKGTKLYRSRTDKWVSGVFGGIGRYLGIDPLPLRIAFLAAAFGFGVIQGIVGYVIASWIMPEEPLPAPTPPPPAENPPPSATPSV